MRKIYHVLALSVMTMTAGAAWANDPIEIPEGTVFIGGSEPYVRMHEEIMDALFTPSDWHFEVQQAPRYLFVDKKGKVAFGIGGNVKTTMQYDFDGSCPVNGSFIPNQIPVPHNPAHRSAFDGTANNSVLYFRLVGHDETIGTYGMYIETQFSAGPQFNEFYVNQAWLHWNYLRFGKITALFNDANAAPFTIDEQGPAGGSCSENMAIQWTPRFGPDERFTIGVGVEVPMASYTLDGNVIIGNNHITHAKFDQEISQRVPDVPMYIQYAWDDRESRVRLSAVMRNLSYRDTFTKENRITTGWGVALSGVVSSIPNTKVFYQAIYGEGIGQYINDMSGFGYDLIPNAKRPGEMIAPRSLGWFAGAQYNILPNLFVSANYSSARLYDQQSLGADAYRQGQYVAANMVYSPFTGLNFGVEYLWGKRINANHAAADANRVMFLASYAF